MRPRVELFHHGGATHFDGALGDGRSLRDGFVGQTFQEQIEDFAVLRCQRLKPFTDGKPHGAQAAAFDILIKGRCDPSQDFV